MEKTTIYGSAFDLESAQGCAEAQTIVSARIQELQNKKQDLEQKLESRFYDFSQSQQDYAAKQETENEITHCQRLLTSLEDKHKSVLDKESADSAKEEIERVKKQSAILADICRMEVPVLSRKLAIIAAALEKNYDEIHRAVDRAEYAGLGRSNIQSPMQQLLGGSVRPSDWYKKLVLPLLDHRMDVYSYWPLPRMENSFKDNPGIQEQVANLLSSDDIAKSVATIFRQIEKREIFIRSPEPKPESHIQHTYKPMWYELPLGSPERNNILKNRIAGTAKRDLGDIIKFWLGLEERRRLNSFIHLLNDNERDWVLAKISKEEHQKYWDYLEYYENDETSEDEFPQNLTA